MSGLIVVGAGIHAHRVIRAAQASGQLVVCCADEHPQSRDCCGVPVLPLEPELQKRVPERYVVAVGDPFVRERLDRTCTTAGWHPQNVVHPFSWISPDAMIGAGVVVLAGAVIEANAHIGRGVIVDLGAIVDHDALVGDYAHLKPGAVVSSRQQIVDYSCVEPTSRS